MQHSLGQLTRVFGRIGLLSFGGPAAQIALMHRELVEDRPWLTEAQFLRALSFCMLLPGPEAMQLATYAGWRLRGVRGGLIAGGLFVLPGALVIAALAMAYGAYAELPLVQAGFLGVKATVVIIVIQAILRLSAKALGAPGAKALAVLSFLALFLFNLPFPLVIALAALWGTLRYSGPAPAGGQRAELRRSLRPLGIGGALWAAPLAAAALAGHGFLLSVGLFFSKLAVVTFGGAYAVLAYMTQEVVTAQGWITTGQMLDALGLAETTPGPLILVTEFVGITAGLNLGGVWLGLLAGLMTLWVTFVPCFIWIFAGAPLIDWLEHRPRINAALSAITAAVVGVIANLSVWFAAHVLFGAVQMRQIGPLHLLSPDWGSFSPLALGLAGLAAALLLWRKWPLLQALGATTAAAVLAGML
ncbi:MAG: chromate efflux transporter [Alphaproteobacteria bacterium]|jgi:chromate transporter|nr:chromate efflux transporter [Alphaproteobacteria bacterium]